MPDTDKVYAGTDCVLQGVLKDEDGNALAAASISALSWWLYETDSGDQDVIGSVSDTALSPVGTYVDASGNLSVPVSNLQNVILDTDAEAERHRAVFKFTYSSKIGIDFIDFPVIANPTLA